jgi:hypothetical protein
MEVGRLVGDAMERDERYGAALIPIHGASANLELTLMPPTRRFGLRNGQWKQIRLLLAGQEGHRGMTAADNRLFGEAVPKITLASPAPSAAQRNGRASRRGRIWGTRGRKFYLQSALNKKHL